MKRIFQYIILLIAVVIVIGSCQHEPLADVPDDIDNSCSPDTVYFVNDVLPIIQSNCAFSGCHGNGSAQDGVDLSTYDNIINTADVRPFDLDGSDLYEVITETDPDKIMPPSPNNPLSTDQIAIIATWINQGALNNSCDDCDTTDVTFSQVISPIIQNFCEGCHSAASPSGGILLTNYSEISTQALNGYLFGTVNHETDYVPMPYNQPKLNQCQIDQLRIWIEEGAPDN